MLNRRQRDAMLPKGYRWKKDDDGLFCLYMPKGKTKVFFYGTQLDVFIKRLCAGQIYGKRNGDKMYKKGIYQH